MRRLNGMDAMLLYTETPNLHTHTLKVLVVDATDCDDDYGFELVRETFRRRLPRLEPLRYSLIDIPWRLHHPMWREDCELDLDYHLRRVRVPPPGGRRELDEVIGVIASTPLDRTRPLWEFHVTEGMAEGRCALIGKVHHCVADGLASANLLTRMMDPTGPDDEEVVEPVGRARPSMTELLTAAARDHVQQIGALPRLLTDSVRGAARVRKRARHPHPDLAQMFDAPPTFLNHVVSPARTFATAALSLADVKETARRLGVTFNDVVLAAAAGGLRELLLRYDGRADRPILASVPVSTDKSGDRVAGNEIGGLSVSLPVHIGEPLQRVRLIALATAHAKRVNDLLGPTLQARMMAYLPPAITAAAFRRLAQRTAQNRVMNVAVSNVPGPRTPGTFGGAPVTEFYSMGILSAGSAMNITVWSYADQVNISVLSDDRTFADVHEATDAMIEAFTEIRGAAGLPAALTPLCTAMAPATAAG